MVLTHDNSLFISFLLYCLSLHKSFVLVWKTDAKHTTSGTYEKIGSHNLLVAYLSLIAITVGQVIPSCMIKTIVCIYSKHVGGGYSINRSYAQSGGNMFRLL